MKRLWLISLLVLPAFFSLLLPSVAHADVNNFTVNDFSAEYYLSRDDPQGALDVRETISVNFTDQNHGILRALPQKYNGMPLHIHVNRVSLDFHSEQYTTYTSNGNEVLKIGDPNFTISGTHVYEVDYNVVNVVRFDGKNANQFIWNANGTGWDQPFLHIEARLHFAASLSHEVGAEKCFTGVQGNTASDCSITANAGTTTFATTRPLAAGENLTMQVAMPANYFVKPTFKDWWADHGTQIMEATILPLLALVVAGTWWYKNGRDIGGRGTIIPEYGPPDDLRAAEADIVAHYKLGKNAISATIIDLAIRKYLKIQESESNGLLGIGKRKNYTFIRLTAPAKDSLKDYEAQIMDGLFTGADTVEMSSLKNKFYTTAQAVQKLIPKNLTVAGYFSRDPKKAGNAGHIVGAVLAFGGVAIVGAAAFVALGAIIGGLIVMFFASLMPKRTQKGEDAKDAIEGLKLYMNTAEKDRIAMLQSPDAPYAAKSAEPVKTVELFEKLLPYAMVLGVEKQWGKQFESIYTTPPDWYGGNWSTFNAIYFTNSLSSSMSAMNSSFAAPSSSGSGSGGGFSGGGGGGGGGGGW